MIRLSNRRLDELGRRYQRLRHALPHGTRFYDYVQCPNYYEKRAADVLRDWHDNPRIASLAHCTPITLN
jgi:hypothetical protein